MPLLEHPEVLIDLFLEALVRDDICEAFSARGVNKIFKNKIEHELITKTTLNRMRWNSSVSIRAWIEKEENATDFLAYRLEHRPGRPDSGKQLPRFLGRVIDKLIEFIPASSNESAVRERYKINLIRILANRLHYFDSHGYAEDSHRTSYFDEIASKYMNEENLNVNDLIAAAAAAVGNLRALEKLTDIPANILGYGVFGNAWTAATIGGKVECIEYLLKQMDSYVPHLESSPSPDRPWHEHPWLPEEIVDAFCVSVKNK